MKQTTETYRLSGALGITTGSLQELQTAGLLKAGLSAEEFNGTLKHMLKGLGEAAGGTGPATEALNKLGLTGNKLAGLKTDEAFKKIAQAISEVKDPTQRASAAMEIFGKEGQSLLPLFMEGAAGIEEAAAKARKFGVALSDVDAAKIAAANEKFEEINLAVQGVENRLTIALAPILGEIADKILGLIPPADKMSSAFNKGLRIVAKAVAYAIDAYGLLKVGVLLAMEGGIAAIEGMIIVVRKLADGLVWVSNKIFHTHMGRPAWIQDSIDAVDVWRKSMHEQVQDAWNQPSAVSKVDAFFDGIQKKADETAKAMAKHKSDMAAPLAEGFGEARKKIDDILKGLQDEVSNFGLTDYEKKLNELKAAGAKPADIAKAQGFVDQLKQLDDLKKMQEEAKKLVEAALSPLDKYQEALKKIDAIRQKGLIDDKVANAARLKAMEEYDKAADPNAGKHAAAETRRFDFKGPAKGPSKADPLSRIAEIATKQAKDVADSKFYLQQLYQFGQNPPTDLTIDF